MEISRHWRLKKQRYGLIGGVCPHCDHKIFPPRGVCPNCGGDIKEKVVAKSTLDSYNTVFKPTVEEAPIEIVFQTASKQPVAA